MKLLQEHKTHSQVKIILLKCCMAKSATHWKLHSAKWHSTEWRFEQHSRIHPKS